MEDIKIKVTDRRLFTEDGELREEYSSESTSSSTSSEPRMTGAKEPPSPAAAPAASAGGEAARREAASSERTREGAASSSASARNSVPTSAPADPPMGPSEHGDPGFVDLVASLAEPIALFLGDARLPGGESAEDLGRARYYIDLLKILRDKTSGNLAADEEAVLGQLLYRLQMRYVQKTR